MLAGLQAVKEKMNDFILAFNKLNFDEFKESEHPRDDEGKFTDGGRSKSGKTGGVEQSPITVKGNELGEYKDIKELRQKAKDYYSTHFQGKTVHKEGLGEIRFTKRGIKETVSHSNDDKLKLVPFIKEIILKGETGEAEKPKHPRNDGIVEFIPIKATVEFGSDKKRAVEVLISKDSRGDFYYDLFTDNLRYRTPPQGYPKQNPGPAEAVSKDTLPQPDLFVNIFLDGEEDEDMTNDSAFGFDKRQKDANGYLRVSSSNLTKEQVAGYYGREISGGNAGYIPDKLYKVYRPAEELKKALPTFNGIPVLIRHKADSAENPQKELRVGVTGTEAFFDGKYIKNALIFHDAAAIDLIESGEQKELSAGYKYTPVEEKGVFEGQEYEIKMTNIVANHIAIVREGRAGGDVRVADISGRGTGPPSTSPLIGAPPRLAKPDLSGGINEFERRRACTAGAKPEPNSPEGAHIWGAVSGEQAPLQGRGELGGGNAVSHPSNRLPVKEDKDMGKKLEQIRKILGLTNDSKPIDIAKAVQTLDEEKDKKDDKKEVTLDDLFGEAEPLIKTAKEKHGEEGEALAAIFAKMKGVAAEAAKAGDEDKDDKKEGEDEDDDEDKKDGKKEDKKAEDGKAFDEAAFEKRLETKFEAKFKAKEKAADDVFPLVGKVSAFSFDSAEAIYAFALKESGYNPKDYAAAGYKGMVDILRQGGKPQKPLAEDGSKDEKPRFDISHFRV
jgi:hypothetical protein